MKSLAKKIFRLSGYDIVSVHHKKKDSPPKNLKDLSKADWELIDFIRPYTRTGPERIVALKNALEYILINKIPGAIVECGVWRGGNIMATAKLLVEASELDRDIFLYDTYEGMSEPSKKDVASQSGEAAEVLLKKENKYKEHSVWCYASIEDVEENIFKTGYPKERFKLIKGRVEDTIPQNIPEKISLLRLDTDWYESTKHELIHLFPKLVKGGVLIIDDYGHWEGARLATDEYIKENNVQILLSRIDYTGRIGIKL